MTRFFLAATVLAFLVASGDSVAFGGIIFPPNVILDHDAVIDAANSYPEPPTGTMVLGITDGPSGPSNVQLVDGGAIGGFTEVLGSSNLTMTGGEIQALTIVGQNATLALAGGVIRPAIRGYLTTEVSYVLRVQDSATLNLHGGQFYLDTIRQQDDSVINIYGYGFSVAGELPIASTPQSTVQVQGYYANGQPFQISISRDPFTAAVFLHTVPEPACWVLCLVTMTALLALDRHLHRRDSHGVR